MSDELSKTHPGETDQPATSLRYGLPGCPSVNADKVPYVVIPGGAFAGSLGVELGDVAAVIYKDRVVYAIVADVGPNCKIGEGSIQLHEKLLGAGHGCTKRDELGVCIKPAASGIEKNALYFIFPGSKAKICDGPETKTCNLPKAKICNGLTPDNINDRLITEGQALMNALKESH
jgi:Fungal chitosanase of glycosyl hydrolase group 75